MWTHSAISRSSQCSTTGVIWKWYELSCLWDGAFKRSLAANLKKVAHGLVTLGFLSHYLSGPLPYVVESIVVRGAGRSSEVERSLMVRWVVGSILHGVDPLSYFSFQPVLHDWCNKGCGMCYPVCGMVHIKEPLLLIDKSSPCGGSGFPFSLSEWSLTICLMPYNRR